MSLRTQIAALLLALSAALVAMTYAVQSLVVMPAFEDLERQAAVRDVNRCVDGLMRDIDTLSNIANDWSAWDDSYQYVVDHNEEFAKGNLVNEAFSSTHINLICILDKDRQIVWGQARDMVTLEAIAAPDLFDFLQCKSNPMTVHENTDDAHQGILLCSKGPVLLAARPMITTRREGPIRGSVIMGRFLNRAEIDSLSRRTHTSLAVWEATSADLPEPAKRCLSRTRSNEKLIELVDKANLHAYTVLKDIYDKPAIVLRAEVKRDISAKGGMAAYLATGCSIAGGVSTLLAMWAVLWWRIVGPLQRMVDHTIRVGKFDDLKARLNFSRSDEIGSLATEFDKMVENLDISRRKVQDVAHRAGMAEIASEVLHNVGNAVNSANCSVEMLDERIAKSKLGGLTQATGLLRQQAPRAAEFFGKDARGLKLIDYLSNLNDILLREQTDTQTEIARLKETVRHIRDAIATQQTFAGRSNFRQDVALEKLVDEVLQINQEFIRSSEIQVQVNLPPLPEVQLNKSKMTQVLVNLVRNAVQSMAGKPSNERTLAIVARRVDEDGIEIDISDTGVGFNEEVRSKLFTHGFTTKLDGNGFGLHYCANAIREVGGQITAHSLGVGQGATFRIRVPNVVPPEKVLATKKTTPQHLSAPMIATQNNTWQES